MKKYLFICLFPLISGCGQLQEIADQLPQEGGYISNAEIAAGLRQALDFGIERQVTGLTKEDGFFKNELVRIGLPPELQKVDRTLRDLGMNALADEGLKVLNRAAEDAVSEATPIFVNAVKEISFNDARNILTGSENAATTYLAEKTTDQLYSKFNPVVTSSLDEVGAVQVWRNIIERYNQLPLTSDVNPDLADYVTREALEGVFTMIAVEEKEIRNNFNARTTDLLRRVFSLQDNL